MMGISGLIISESIMPAFGLGNGPDAWEDIHEAASQFTLLIVLVHVGMHWKWIWNNTKKYIVKKIRRPASA